MQGILEDTRDGGGRMTLRCLDCWREHGVVETNIPSMSLLAGLKSFRPVMKRLLRVGPEILMPALRGQASCLRCGRPMSARVVSVLDMPAVGHYAPMYADRFYVVASCPRCELYGSGAATIAGLEHPHIAKFIIERER